MPSRFLISIILAFVVASCSIYPSCDAEPDISYFSIRLVDDDGIDTDKVLGERYTVDTVTNIEGTKYFLKAHKTISASSIHLLIDATDGKYNSYVSMENLPYYLSESGIMVELSNNSEVFHANLTKANNYNAYFEDNLGFTASLDPGIAYPMTIRPLNDISSYIVPEEESEIKIEFTVHLKSGIHQVAFYSEGDLVQAYKLADGQAITELPTPNTRDGYKFMGWYLPNGQELTEGYVVTADDADIVATAKWASESSSSINFNWWIPLLILIIIGVGIAYWRHRRSASTVEPI